jgi:hypothetical protein
VLLLLVFTFNAYACVLPLQPESAMECSSASEQPVRQACDAFLQLGPQSYTPLAQDLPTLNVELEAAAQLPLFKIPSLRPEHPQGGADTALHLSIPTTVLRI